MRRKEGYILSIYQMIMMYEFNKKQKIIIAIIGSMIIIAFLYYIYTKEDESVISTEEIVEENMIENTAENLEENEETTKEDTDKIIVHVSGAVNKEGIVKLEENSRISDAIDKAEGLKENADTKNINLAFKLEDGMKIYIPTIGESREQNEQNGQSQNQTLMDETSKYVTSSSGVVQEEQTNGKSEQKKNEKININTATQTQLETLPGIGPSTSLKIVNYREENGKFKNIEDIKEVSGIGDVKYENIKDLICVE